MPFHHHMDLQLISISGCFDGLDTLQDIIPDVEFAAAQVETAACRREERGARVVGRGGVCGGGGDLGHKLSG